MILQSSIFNKNSTIQIKNITSISIFILVMLLVVWGWRAHSLLYFLLLFAFGYSISRGEFTKISGEDRRFILLSAQYFLAAGFFLIFHATEEEIGAREFLFNFIVVSPFLWVIVATLLVISALVFSNFKYIYFLFFKYSGYFLLFVFLLLTLRYITDAEKTCRMRFLTENVFMLSFFFCTFASLQFLNWRVKTPTDKVVALLVICCALIVVTIFSGTRGFMIAQSLFVIAIALYLAIVERQYVYSLILFMTIPFAIFISVIFDQYSGCGMTTRIVALLDIFAFNPFGTGLSTNEQISTLSLESSMGHRRDMYIAALRGFIDSPIVGYGLRDEINFTYRKDSEMDYFHVHNIFLSWLIWGGVFMFASGIMFLLAPWLAFPKEFKFERFVLLCSTFLLIGAVQMFDSFLADNRFLFYFVITWPLSFFAAKHSANLYSQRIKESKTT